MKQVIRKKGWGPLPTKEQFDAHKGQWLGRYRDNKTLFNATSTINNDVEFLAVDDDATPVEVSVVKPPDFTYGGVQYYRMLGCAWKAYRDGGCYRTTTTYASTAQLLHGTSTSFLEAFFNKFPL